MVIRNLENKIKLVGIICSFFLAGCIIISVSSIWTARTMVTDAQKKVYVLDGNQCDKLTINADIAKVKEATPPDPLVSDTKPSWQKVYSQSSVQYCVSPERWASTLICIP